MASAWAGPEAPVSCTPVDRPLRVDGRLEEEIWSRAVPAPLQSREQLHPGYQSAWKGPEDLSATVRVAASPTVLYVGIDVRDDTILHESGRAWWVGDCIELFLGTDQRKPEEDERYSEDDYQIFLMPFHEGLRWAVASRGPGTPYPDGGLRGIEVAWQVKPGGYTVEAAIPLGNFPALRPGADGCIGFDVALNDVDEPGATQPESYMTLSGRFDLYLRPANFGKLQVAEALRPPEVAATTPTSPFDGKVIGGGLLGVALLALTARRLARRIARRTTAHNAVVCGAFGLAALLVYLSPHVILWADEGLTLSRHGEALRAVEAAANGFLSLDEAPAGAVSDSADRLFLLLRDGRVKIRPRYRYDFLPTSPRARQGPADHMAEGAIRYSIALEPGAERTFPLDDRRSWRDLRFDLSIPWGDERVAQDTAAAEVLFDLPDAQRRTTIEAKGTDPRVWITVDPPSPVRSMTIRNLLTHRTIQINAVYEMDEAGQLTPVPLATYSPTGVPLDIWREAPTTHIVTLPKKSRHVVGPVGRAGRLLWFAFSAEGAYPRTASGLAALAVRVIYSDGRNPLEARLLNGSDVYDQQLLYAQAAGAPERVALEWESAGRMPVHYTLHSLTLDPDRAVDHIEFEDLGVVEAIRLVAVTLAQRTSETPASPTGLMLGDDVLTLRPDTRRALAGLAFVVRAPDRVAGATAPAEGVRSVLPLPFADGRTGALEVWMPHAGWVRLYADSTRIIYGAAALLLALAAVAAGGGLLHRARRLRLKMLVALGAATAAPLLFLFVALPGLLGEGAEGEIREATLEELRTVGERILVAGRARARELASRTRDVLDLALLPAGEAFDAGVKRQRTSLDSEGAFLCLPGMERSTPSALGNSSFFNVISRPGLYFSPWDGLVAVGVARFRSPGLLCLVGLRTQALLGEAPRAGTTHLLFGPGGEPLASSGGSFPGSAYSAEGRAEAAERVRRIVASAAPSYEPRAAIQGQPVSAAFDVLRDNGRVVGMIGVFRSRAATEGTQAAVYETLFLSGLAALLLVVLSGGMLADRVTLRLRRVTTAAQSLAEGELSQRVPVEAEDEVGRLASAFNTMADALDSRVRQMTELHSSLQALTAALDREAVAETAAGALARATGARQVSVSAVDAAGGRIEPLHRAASAAPPPLRVPEKGPEREAIDRQRPVFGDGSLYLPLVAAGRTVGLAICSPVAEGAAPDEEFLDSTARQIGIALENARLFRAAVTDDATGLYTHDFFVRRLKEEVDRASASGRPLAILRIAIEGFDALRTGYGAAAATRLVAEVAETVVSTLPRRNLLARRDAGEIEALLVESDGGAAARGVDEIASALQKRPFPQFDAGGRPVFTYRTVVYPRDGAGAEILLDALGRAPGERVEADPALPSALRFPPQVASSIGRSPVMRAALEVVARVARTNATVLLTGETGAGKEVLADLIQANSDRRDSPYVKVNCAAIPETLVESELFGHERGAFTGAERRRIGRFEQADKGTLFLDEIGDLSPAMQAKLLRVLQERSITRVGGSESIAVDVRILAATHKDLEEMMRRGEFREDLYHRLHVIVLRVPPLRERREELPALLEEFRERFNRRHGLNVAAFSPAALDALHAHPWPGNIRELRNVVERSMLLAQGEIVERAQLPIAPSEAEPRAAAAPRIDGLTPRQERILSLARQGGGLTNGDVVATEKISARTALRELQALVERGLLLRVGRRRGATYRPADTSIPEARKA